MKRILILSLTLLTATGCLRGESKSLDEIFQIAKSTYASSPKSDLPPEVSQQVDRVAQQLDAIAADMQGKDITTALNQISDGLSTLLPHAGYTVRPALTELRNQYLELTEGKSPTQQELKLLASRTFNTMGEELRTTKFGIAE